MIKSNFVWKVLDKGILLILAVFISSFQAYALPPTVTSLIPNIGPTTGGTAVTINGTNFVAPVTVTIGGASATSVSVLNNITITAVTPPNASGPANVVVTTPGGTSTGIGLFNYTDAPTITSIGSTMGSEGGGTWVSINGANFNGVTGVKFGAVPAASYSVWSTTSLSVLSPPGTGTVDVTVITTNGTTAITPADQFTYIPLPTVTSIFPTSGPTGGGTSVVITGTNFTGLMGGGVKFGTTLASYIVNSPTQITATSPNIMTGGIVDVTVTNPTGTSAISAADKFTYVPPPILTSASPAIGPATGGTTVVITGTDFITVNAVTFGGVPAASYTVNSPTQITAITPPGTNITPIQVTTASGMSMPGITSFTYVPAPTVYPIVPTNGPTSGGTMVMINGMDFTGVTAVKFGAVSAASYTVSATNQITAIAPLGTGTVGVTVTAIGGTSAINPWNQFTYVPPPTITSISPAAGPDVGGSSVVITGTDFTGVTAVKFGALAAASYTVNSATQITAISPFRGSPGVVDITVTALGGTNTISAADQFTYIAPIAPPTVTGIAPNNGLASGGTSVVITGTDFTSVSAVNFGTIPAASYTVNSATQITAISPANFISTPVDIRITAIGGTSPISLADQFSYIHPANVLSLSLTRGPASGGSTIVITGSYFVGVTAVNFGAVPAASYTVNSIYQITAITPPGSGNVWVSVTGMGGTGLSTNFIYDPTVNNIAPNTGTETGGTNVIITGTGFDLATGVNFGFIPAASYTVNSATQITATSPPGVGIIDVTVINAVGAHSPVNTADQFRYVLAPVVTNVSPNSGPTAGGTTVIIIGSNFTGATAVNFGSSSASFIVNSPTQITATAPIGTGIVDITVTTPGGTSVFNAADKYTYVPVPVVTGISPTAGPASGGATVVITGTNFTGATVVNFGAAVATFVVNSATQITATAPPGTGIVNVTVTTSGGTSVFNAADQFTYSNTPTVIGISPATGPYTGGTLVTITGTNFAGATSVTIGGAAATGITVVNPTTITAIVPPGTAGPQNIVVTAPSGIGTGTGLFTYIGAAAGFRITSITQQTAGGAFSVTITATDGLGNTDVAYQPINNLHFVTTAGTAPNGVSVPILPIDGKPVFVNGVATITGFTLYKAETGVTISVSELTTVKTGTSNLFNVDPASAATLRVQ